MPSLEREMVVKQSNLVDLVLKVEDSSRERHSGAQNFLPLTQNHVLGSRKSSNPIETPPQLIRQSNDDQKHDRSVSQTKHLIETLTKKQTMVTDDTILLINQAEVLAKDGIHGKIGQVGVGFGTGRHTSIRKSIDQQKSYQESPLREKSGLYKSGSKIPYISTRDANVGDYPVMRTQAVSTKTGPKQLSGGNDAISNYMTNKAISLRTQT